MSLSQDKPNNNYRGSQGRSIAERRHRHPSEKTTGAGNDIDTRD